MKDKKVELGTYWLEKAQRSFKTAKQEFKHENYDFCINRLYYSVFYAVSAVLILKGKSYKKHSGVRVALHRDFVKEGVVPVKYGKLYDALFQDRQEADYVAFVEFDPEVVRDELKQTEEFIAEFEELFYKLLEN